MSNKNQKRGYKFNNSNSMLAVLREIKREAEMAVHQNKNLVTLASYRIEELKKYQKENGIETEEEYTQEQNLKEEAMVGII